MPKRVLNSGFYQLQVMIEKVKVISVYGINMFIMFFCIPCEIILFNDQKHHSIIFILKCFFFSFIRTCGKHIFNF